MQITLNKVLALSCLLLFVAVGMPPSTNAAKPSLDWEAYDGNLVITFNKIQFNDITNYLWNGQDITSEINQLIADGDIVLIFPKSPDHFSMKVANPDFDESGLLEVQLLSGEICTIGVLANPVPTLFSKQPEAAATSRSPASATANCGSLYDSADIYPCCPNVLCNSHGKNCMNCQDGNCTWYAWYRAHQTYHGWSTKLPGWGNARDWAKNAAKSSGYKVVSTPRSSSQGYCIGVNTTAAGGLGHVAWVYSYDSSHVWVDEMLCTCGNSSCNTSTSGTPSCISQPRIGQQYSRSYFNAGYIVRK